MRLFVVACVWIAACRQPGTIEIEVSDAIKTCTADAAYVTATFLLDGECGTCACNMPCPICMGDTCTRVCTGSECPPDKEIELVPPSAGSYAVVLRYYNSLDEEEAVVCFKLDVDADGTQSRKQVTGTTGCCQ
ncbi:MAG: hypothetical protein ACKV2T_38815 [Kofleriaceae bacterium]